MAHRHVYEAICAGDQDKAEEWMEKHMRDFRRGIETGNLGFDQPVQG